MVIGEMYIMKKWDKKNALRILLYSFLYFVGTLIVCVLGSVHPIMFVCYQITAGLLITGVVTTAFDKVKSFGVPLCLATFMIIVFFIIQDASLWHCIPLLVIAAIAEIVRAATKYSWKGDIAAAVIMTFSTFGYYGQIWFNRIYTYECAVEEMPAGYADTLMSVSPMWALPVVVIIGVLVSIGIAELTAKLFKFDK